MALLVVVLAGACGGGTDTVDAPGGDGGGDARADGGGPPDADTTPGFFIRGRAFGVRTPTTLVLDAGGVVQRLVVTEDGEPTDSNLTFPEKVPDQTPYTVAVQGTSACSLDPATVAGTVSGADVTDVALYCPGIVELVQLTTSYPMIRFVPAFDHEATTVTATRPFLVQPDDTFTLTATQYHVGLPAMTVNGATTASGTPSAPVSMNADEPGPNAIEATIALAHPRVTAHTYRVDLVAAPPGQEAYAKASDASASHRMHVVALDGDTLVVGAPYGGSGASGAVYVFRRNGLAWAQEARLVAAQGDPGDNFGLSVAISGDTVVVGAPFEASAATGVGGDEANDAAPAAGAVYVYRRDAATMTWSREAYIKASNTEAGDQFGTGVAIAGDRIAVGAPYEDSSANAIGGDQSNNARTNAGAVYVFARSGTVWSQDTYVKPTTSDIGDAFGTTVALAGATLAVGVPQEDSGATQVGGNQADDSEADAGAVYVFTRGTAWTQQAYVKASNTGAGDAFGAALSLSRPDGAVMAVGAPDEDGPGDAAANAGAVYVYRRAGTTWSFDALVRPAVVGAQDRYGIAVAIDRDNLAVGVEGEDGADTGFEGNPNNDAASQAGAAYVFRRRGPAWQMLRYVKASNTNANDQFGRSVAIAFDTLVVGAPGESSNGSSQGDNSAANAGAVYVFR